MRPPTIAVILVTSLLAVTSLVAVSADVQLTASPREIHAGFTSRLNVTCSFQNDDSSSSVMSIQLSKTKGQTEVFMEIASVTSDSPHDVTVQASFNATVTGGLSTAGGLSYISLQWTYPSEEAKGAYKCEAFTMDKAGHPQVSTTFAEITEKFVDLDALQDKMRETELRQQQQLDTLQSQVSQLSARLAAAQSATFAATATFRSHAYFLSRTVMRDAAVHESSCRVFGGHLVEVDDKDEHQFLAGFLNNNSVAVWTEIGGTDIGHKGTYTFTSSGSPVTYLDWATGEPSSQLPNCLFLSSHAGSRQFFDGPCVDERILGKYICEVPQ